MNNTQSSSFSLYQTNLQFEKDFQKCIYLESYIQQNLNNLYNHCLYDRYLEIESHITGYFKEQEKILQNKKCSILTQVRTAYREALQVIEEKIASIYSVTNKILDIKQRTKKQTLNKFEKEKLERMYQNISSFLGIPIKNMMTIPELPQVRFSKNIQAYIDLCCSVDCGKPEQVEKREEPKNEREKETKKVRILEKLNNFSMFASK